MNDKKKTRRRGFENNKAWQAGRRLVPMIYRITQRFPRSERFGLTDQMQRAAVSVPSNIAEGCAMSSDGLYLRQVRIARGSLAELETQLLIAKDLGYLPETLPDELRATLDETARLTTGLWRYLSKKVAD